MTVDVLSVVGLAAYVSGVGFLLDRLTAWLVVSFGYLGRHAGLP